MIVHPIPVTKKS